MPIKSTRTLQKRSIVELTLLSIALFLMGVVDVDAQTISATDDFSAGLIYQNEQGEKISTTVLKSDVNMQVNGLINRVTVKQTFRNDSTDWINALYLFPLPENAAVDHLNMKIGERVIVGEIKEKHKAKEIYKKAKSEGKKASLIEQVKGSVFTTRVANIAPNETIEVTIEYQQSIDYKAGEFSLRYPMTLTPRYAAENKPLTQADQREFVKQLAKNDQTMTGQEKLHWDKKWQALIDAGVDKKLAMQTLSSIKTEKDPDILVSLTIDLNTPSNIVNVDSLYHRINAHVVSATEQEITLRDQQVIANRDFVLTWRVKQSEQPESNIFKQYADDGEYGLLTLMPPSERFSQAARISKEVIFVIDVSGSMSGVSMEQAKAALHSAIDQLNDNDTFNIISFNNNTDTFASNSLPVDERSKAMAHTYVTQLNAGGGTNLAPALQASLVGKRTVFEDEVQAVRQVVFITDAAISDEQALLNQIEQQRGDSRLFMVGIGSAPNSFFMKSSAKLGHGSFTNIGDNSEVETKMNALFTQLSSPVLTNIDIRYENGDAVDFWPNPIADLYQGEPLQVAFKLEDFGVNSSPNIIVTGQSVQNGIIKKWQQTVSTNGDNSAAGIDLMWAKTQVDSIALSRKLTQAEKQSQITQLALDHHFVTQYTSLVAVEKVISRPEGVTANDKLVKTHLPKGNTMRLPQTGLASFLFQVIGVLILLFAAFIGVANYLTPECDK